MWIGWITLDWDISLQSSKVIDLLFGWNGQPLAMQSKMLMQKIHLVSFKNLSFAPCSNSNLCVQETIIIILIKIPTQNIQYKDRTERQQLLGCLCGSVDRSSC